MARIRVLSERVINQIAAGEVIERPASAVKELVENSLDASADSVAIEIERGGTRLIRVTDNGSGMGREDALLCFERHATSKIESEQDLFSVASLGFRGEALASIAAVARVELETAERGSDIGTRIVMAGGVVDAVEDIARPPGSTVSVRHLFYNVPVRRGFLRGVETETRAVMDAVFRLALARPDCGFRLVVEGREVWNLPSAGDLRARLHQLIGGERADRLTPVKALAPGIAVEGFVGVQPAARTSRRQQVIVINGRPAEAPIIRGALAELLQAGGTVGRAEAYLHLRVDPAALDVNVHPAKLEVRFRDPGRIRTALAGALKSAAHDAGGGDGGLPASSLKAQPVSAPGAHPGEFLSLVAEGGIPWGSQEGTWQRPARVSEGAQRSVPLIQVANAYLVTRVGDALTIFDQHACHERVVYEQTLRRLAGVRGMAQQLLFPLTVDLSPQELSLAEEYEDDLRQAGFDIRLFGRSTVIVEAVPADIQTDVTDELVHKVLAGLGDEKGALAGRHHRVASSIACHSSVRAGQALSEEQMRGLIDQLLATETPHACPHGRPTFIQITAQELERRFQRT